MIGSLGLTPFGKYCVQRRTALGRTMMLMAEALGVDMPYLSAVECGNIIPPECYVERVAEYFGDKIEYVKVKVLRPVATIEVPFERIERRDTTWPENVVSFAEFKNRRWLTTSTSPEA